MSADFKRMSYEAWQRALGEVSKIQGRLLRAGLPQLSNTVGDDGLIDRLEHQRNPAAAGYLLAKLAETCTDKGAAELMSTLAKTLQEFDGVEE